jgi:hypothetical protein
MGVIISEKHFDRRHNLTDGKTRPTSFLHTVTRRNQFSPLVCTGKFSAAPRMDTIIFLGKTYRFADEIGETNYDQDLTLCR